MLGHQAVLYSTKSLELAYEHTSNAWFPADPQVISKVKTRLEQGYYRSDRDALVEDIKSDFSLYIYCLKELQLMAGCSKRSQSFDAGSRQSSVITLPLLHASPVEALERVVSKNIDRLSDYALQDMTDFQAVRLRESMLSAATAQALSASCDVDPELGFACALLRQLGLTLISWNYPNVYRRALDSVTSYEESSEEDLDTLLHSSLGFSPMTLGVRFAETWGFCSNVVSVLRSSVSGEDDFGLEKRSLHEGTIGETSMLSRLCCIGEAFAKANNPQQYPQARSEWKRAESVIRNQLGLGGISTIYEYAQVLCEGYARFAPEALHFENDLPNSLSESGHGRELFERNVFLKACPTWIRRRLAAVYAGTEAVSLSESQLRMLIHEVIPSFGFDCSCIFMHDPALGALMPTLKVGSPVFVKLKPLSLTNINQYYNPITEAFSGRAPLRDEGTSGAGKKRIFLAGVIGERNRIGVFHLEISDEKAAALGVNPLLLFRALVTCLNDLLHVA